MRGTGAPKQWRRPSPFLPSSRKKLPFSRTPSKRFLKFVSLLILVALIPPFFFHFRLKRFQQIRLKKCGWLESPPLVCAHGGDSSKAVPNTMDAYRMAIDSNLNCIEIDVSRSLDGELFALHDRDLQRMSGNSTTKVGFMSMKEIKELDAGFQLKSEFHNQRVPTLEDALTLVSSSSSFTQVILDIKVGPPSHEKGLANDVLSIVKRTNCKNCLIWSKSDVVGRDVIKLTKDTSVGYIVMKDFVTGATSKLLRIKDAAVVGVYHPLIEERLVRIVHGKGKKVYAWTVDDADSMRRLLIEHIDAIVTGDPSLLQSIMEDMKRECHEEGFSLP